MLLTLTPQLGALAHPAHDLKIWYLTESSTYCRGPLYTLFRKGNINPTPDL
jgi:hypothetical protein